jgi:superfamily II DNA or RNA helicase
MHHLLAYIDPGSGSLIIQALIAGIVAIPFFFRQQIGRVVRAVRKTDATESTTSTASTTSSTSGQTTDQTS